MPPEWRNRQRGWEPDDPHQPSRLSGPVPLSPQHTTEKGELITKVGSPIAHVPLLSTICSAFSGTVIVLAAYITLPVLYIAKDRKYWLWLNKKAGCFGRRRGKWRRHSFRERDGGKVCINILTQKHISYISWRLLLSCICGFAHRVINRKQTLGKPDQRDLNENLAATHGLAHMIQECRKLFRVSICACALITLK